jgi:hypothetical protein
LQELADAAGANPDGSRAVSPRLNTDPYYRAAIKPVVPAQAEVWQSDKATLGLQLENSGNNQAVILSAAQGQDEGGSDFHEGKNTLANLQPVVL